MGDSVGSGKVCDNQRLPELSGSSRESIDEFNLAVQERRAPVVIN
jgi:hypothetical protein